MIFARAFGVFKLLVDALAGTLRKARAPVIVNELLIQGV